MAGAGTTDSRWTVRLLWAVFALLALLPGAAVQASGLEPGPLSNDPVWTDRPVRIDRKSQSFERIPVARQPQPLRLHVSSRVTVFDSGSFLDGGRIYVLSGVVPVDPKRRCRREDGGIAICGQQARLMLRRLIINADLSCEEDLRSGDLSFLTCARQGKDLAAALVAEGAGWAAMAELAGEQAEAMRVRKGIWADAQCLALQRCPPAAVR